MKIYFHRYVLSCVLKDKLRLDIKDKAKFLRFDSEEEKKKLDFLESGSFWFPGLEPIVAFYC